MKRIVLPTMICLVMSFQYVWAYQQQPEDYSDSLLDVVSGILMAPCDLLGTCLGIAGPSRGQTPGRPLTCVPAKPQCKRPPVCIEKRKTPTWTKVPSKTPVAKIPTPSQPPTPPGIRRQPAPPAVPRTEVPRETPHVVPGRPAPSTSITPERQARPPIQPVPPSQPVPVPPLKSEAPPQAGPPAQAAPTPQPPVTQIVPPQAVPRAPAPPAVVQRPTVPKTEKTVEKKRPGTPRPVMPCVPAYPVAPYPWPYCR